MSWGFQTISTDGDILQIDQDYQNLGLVYKGTAVTTDSFGTAPGLETSTINITYPGGLQDPIIAYRCANPMMIIEGTETSAVFYAKGPPGVSFNYYIFDKIASNPTSGWGIAVYKEDGVSSSFRSDYKYMTVVGQIGCPKSFLTPGNEGTTVSAFAGTTGREYAAAQSMAAVRMMATTTSGGQGAVPCRAMSAGVRYTSGGLICGVMRAFDFNGGLGLDTIGTDGDWLVVDVTGY